jgi:transmembrane sensor
MKEPIDEEYVKAAELVSKYIRGDISAAEYNELLDMLKKYPTLHSWIDNQNLPLKDISKRLTDYQTIDIEKDWQSVLKKHHLDSERKPKYRIWWAVAASVIAVCVVGGSFLLKNKEEDSLAEKKQEITEIVPGRTVATLTLSDGTTTLLEEQEHRTLVDGDITLALSGSTLDYQIAKDATPQQHKLQVPLGGTYHIRLADGTNVWLNADSELEFPSSFIGDERKVKVRGEAYFEVARDATKPFKVLVGKTEVEALGTAFNINTHLYKEEIKTILTEGKIKVSTPADYKIIEPGYAAISGKEGIKVGKADVEEALAWKEGYFYFDSKRLKEVLSDVARWYNLELDVTVPLADKRYIGGMKKSESIEAVCAVLSDLTSYRITVQGKKLVVK